MSAVRLSFANCLKPIIYWDVSYAIACLVDTEQYHSECVAFRKRLQKVGVLSVVSDFVYDELSFFLVRQALAKEGRQDSIGLM